MPSARERYWTVFAHPTLSLQSPRSNIDCLAAKGASSSIGSSNHVRRFLRHSARFSLQNPRNATRVWQRRPVYDGSYSRRFFASGRARCSSCWINSCRGHASGLYTTRCNGFDARASPAYGRRELSVFGHVNAYENAEKGGNLETTDAISGRVGTLARHFAMGVTHDSSRIHHSVSKRPASFPRNSSHGCETRGSRGAAARNDSSAEERGYRRSTPLSDGVRFLQPLFCCTKKRGRFATHIGSTPFESCTQDEQIQDVNGKVHFVSDSTKHLVCHDRSEGCIFSYSDHQETQEVPQIRFRGQSVSIPCSSVRLSPGSPNFFKMHGRSSGPVAAPGRSCVELLGRLAGASSITDSSTLSPRFSAESFKQPGLMHEFPEECFNPLSTDNLSGNRFGLSRDDSQTISPARSVSHVMRASLQSRPHSDGEFVSQAVRSDGSGIPCNSSGLTSHAPFSVVDEKSEHFTPLFSASYDFGDTEVCYVNKTVDVNRVPSSRSSAGDLCFPRDCHDGRVFDRLGSCLSRAPSSWSVDSDTTRLAHKQVGTTGSFSSSPVFLKSADRPSCTTQVRQHGGCVIPESSRRVTLSPPVQAGEEYSSLVSEQISIDPSSSCPRTFERRSGSAIQTDSGAGGMEITPTDGEPFMADIRRGESGLIRVEHDYALPAVVLPMPSIAPRPGCVSSRLAQDQLVCFSSNSFNSSGVVQDTAGQSGAAAAGGSVVAHTAVVCGTGQSNSGLSMGDSPQTGLTIASTRDDLAPKARSVETVGVASERSELICPGLSAETSETIMNSRAASTRRLYAFKWKLFTTWCGFRSIDPVYCPVASVLEFLQDRFSDGVTPATLKVYVAAISANHVYMDGASVGRHPLVSRFLQGARRLRPFRPVRVPSWDLSIVLQGLSGHPFEPLETVPDKILTLKTVLLMALSSLKRVGDLQALSVSPSCMDFAPGFVKVLLRPRPNYVPKVASNPFHFQQTVLEALPPAGTGSEDLSLCPVRALKTYVDRSASWRESDQLFVCFGHKNRGHAVTKQRMSHWLVEAISLAYEARGLASPLGVKAHSTRAVASSQAALSGSSMADICAAAGWSSPNTFIKFYSLDVRTAPGSRVLSA